MFGDQKVKALVAVVLTDKLFVWIESEPAAWPLLLHANEISTDQCQFCAESY